MFATCLQATQTAAADLCLPRPLVDGFAWWKEGRRLSDTLGLKPMKNRPAIVDIRQILEDSLTAEGVEQSLRAANRLLDGRRPIDLLNEGDTESVRKAAQAFLDGAYV